MNSVIKLDVPDYQIGQEVTVYFKDTMTQRSVCTAAESMEKIRFMLNGCDIAFVAEAPANITLKELLAQTNKIKPHWCACGIRSLTEDEEVVLNTEIFIEKDSIRVANEDVCADIDEDEN